MTKLYDPTATPVADPASLAARLPDLRGKVVGLLDISKAQGNHFLDRIEEWLHETHHPSAVVRRTKPTFARPAPEDMRKELEQQCDMIIEALAD